MMTGIFVVIVDVGGTGDRPSPVAVNAVRHRGGNADAVSAQEPGACSLLALAGGVIEVSCPVFVAGCDGILFCVASGFHGGNRRGLHRD